MGRYKYKRPDGEKHVVSIRKWNRIFAKRGNWPFVKAEVYIEGDRAIIHYVISFYGKALLWSASPLFYLALTIMHGLPEAHKGFMDAAFDKSRGRFSSDEIYKRHGDQWNKLLDLLGR